MALTQSQIAAMQRRAFGRLHDQCVRLIYTPVVDADGRKGTDTYVDGETLLCRLVNSRDGTQRSQERGDMTSTTPHIHVPRTSGFGSRDRVRVTHIYGQELEPPLVFSVAGEPIQGPLTMSFEVSRVTTGGAS